MNEPKALYQLCEEWRELNNEQADDCSDELEAALRAWDAALMHDQPNGLAVEEGAWVREHILGIKP